jgi:hypothetical protein
MRELPPWWHVYPEAVLGVRTKQGGERYLAVCRCGAVGAPEALGWMGDTCGPCFDRRAEGGTASGGYGQFAEWSPRMTRFAFTPDGRHLVGQDVDGRFRKVCRDDGSSVTSNRKTIRTVTAAGTGPLGVHLVTQEGTVYRWTDGADDIELLLRGRHAWGRTTLTPDGRRGALISYQEALTTDLTDPHPSWTRQPAPVGLYMVQYAPDGSRLLATTVVGELRALDPAMMESEVLRADAFDGQSAWSGAPPELAVAPDGSAVLLRREMAFPRRATLRHVPIPAGKVVELRVPTWHRATSMAYSPDGRFAVTAESESGWVGFFDTASGKSLGFVRAVMEDLGWRSGQIEFAPGGTAVAVPYNTLSNADSGTTVAVWPWPDVTAAAL